MFEPQTPQTLVKIKDLKPGVEGIHVVVRVLESLGIRNISTRSGERTIGEYIVGDETGRVKLVAWGSKAVALAVGDVVEIRGAWVSVFRGELQLNIGRGSSITRLEDNAVVDAESIPEEFPSPPIPTARGEHAPTRSRRSRRSGPRFHSGKKGRSRGGR